MNNEEKILSLLEKMDSQLSKLEAGQDNLQSQIDNIALSQAELIDTVEEVKDTVTRIEQEHGKHLVALHDGHIQNASKIERIEQAVTKQDEFILKRVF